MSAGGENGLGPGKERGLARLAGSKFFFDKDLFFLFLKAKTNIDLKPQLQMSSNLFLKFCKN